MSTLKTVPVAAAAEFGSARAICASAPALVETQAPLLARQLDESRPLLGLEPSCLLTLADEWDRNGSRSHEAPHRRGRPSRRWLLASQIQQNRCSLALRPREEHCLIHPHCHQKALGATNGTLAVLKLVPHLQVTALDVGCYGMAGSFGYEAEHFDLSVQIATSD